MTSQQTSEQARTFRGFRIFYGGPTGFRTRRVEVIESSLAGQGPHVRIFGGRIKEAHVHLSLADAHNVRDALTLFIDEAERGLLKEPAPPSIKEGGS